MPPSVACVKVAHQLTWTSCQSSWKSSNTPKWLTPCCVQWDCEAQIYFHSEWLDFDSASPNDGDYLTTWRSISLYQTHALRQSVQFFFWSPLPWRSQSRWVECNFSKSSREARPCRSAQDSPPSPRDFLHYVCICYFVHTIIYYITSYRVAHLSAFILLVSFLLIKDWSC